MCTEKKMNLHVENTGQFPFDYFIQKMPIGRPSVAYMTQVKKEGIIKKDPNKAADISGKDKGQLPTEYSNIR